MDWLEVTVPSEPGQIDALQDRLLCLNVSGLVVNDEAVVQDFIENGKKYWDYIDEDFLRSVQGVCNVQFYLEDSPAGRSELERIKSALNRQMTVRTVRNEDWENNWKQYYVPVEIGRRLVVVPEWLTVEGTDRTQLRLDPGLIFGTGSHATTRMCLEAIEEQPGRRVLDLGCGSGILAIAALLLGAERAVGCDIDEKAPGVVRSNAALNHIGEERLAVYAGDILADTKLKRTVGAEKYDLVLANIVADVILALAPAVPALLTEEGRFVCSGIIDGREDEIENALTQAHLTVVRHRQKDNWHCFESIRERGNERGKED